MTNRGAPREGKIGRALKRAKFGALAFCSQTGGMPYASLTSVATDADASLLMLASLLHGIPRIYQPMVLPAS